MGVAVCLCSRETEMRDEITRRVRILLVDDSPKFANVMAALLEHTDDRFTITSEPSGQAALDHLADNPVDCIISDYEMPGKNGLELFAAVREDHPSVGFILMSNHDPAMLATEATNAGVDAFYQKTSGVDQYAEVARHIRSLVEEPPADPHSQAVPLAHNGSEG